MFLLVGYLAPSLVSTAVKYFNFLYRFIGDDFDSRFSEPVLDAVSVAPLFTPVALDPDVIAIGCLVIWWLGVATLPAIVVLAIHRMVRQAHLQVAIHASIVHYFVFFVAYSTHHLVHASCIVSAHLPYQV